MADKREIVMVRYNDDYLVPNSEEDARLLRDIGHFGIPAVPVSHAEAKGLNDEGVYGGFYFSVYDEDIHAAAVDHYMTLRIIDKKPAEPFEAFMASEDAKEQAERDRMATLLRRLVRAWKDRDEATRACNKAKEEVRGLGLFFGKPAVVVDGHLVEMDEDGIFTIKPIQVIS